MTGDSLTWFWGVISVGVTIFTALGVRSIYQRKQSQKLDRGSLGIQAGGDVNLGGSTPPSGDPP